MDSIIYIIFTCMALPLLLSIGLMDKRSKLLIGFIIIGAFMCVFVSELNTVLLNISGKSLSYVTTNITPVTEEIVKALPILIFAFVFSDNREMLISLSMAVGIGFAIVENLYIFSQRSEVYTLFWAIKRVFGASLMHALCTSAVGYGISFVRKRKKLFYTGTIALLDAAIVLHSVYNGLIQSSVPTLGFLLPIAVYLIVMIMKYPVLRKRRNKQNTTQAPQA